MEQYKYEILNEIKFFFLNSVIISIDVVKYSPAAAGFERTLLGLYRHRTMC